MAVVLFTRPRVINYRTSLFSSATVIYLLGLVIAWIVPFFVIYGSGRVWNQLSLLNSEQPKINFKYELIMKAVTHEDGDFLTFSTFSDYNEAFAQFLRVPVIKVTEVDSNEDGKNDRMEMELSLPLKPTEGIRRMELLLLFDYLLESQTFEMESAAHVDVSTGVVGSGVEVVGNLRLFQSKALPHFLDNELYNVSAINSSSGFDMFAILNEYNKRAVRTELQVVLLRTKMPGSLDNFLLKATIHYHPQSNIIAETTAFDTFKWAYVQYVYVALLFIHVISVVTDYLSDNGLVYAFPSDFEQRPTNAGMSLSSVQPSPRVELASQSFVT